MRKNSLRESNYRKKKKRRAGMEYHIWLLCLVFKNIDKKNAFDKEKKERKCCLYIISQMLYKSLLVSSDIYNK